MDAADVPLAPVNTIDRLVDHPQVKHREMLQEIDHPRAGKMTVFGFPIKLWGFLPHMHTKGRAISMVANDTDCLVDVPKWDFHWQTQYFRRSPYQLPANGKLTMKCSWDNPTNATVRWGEGTNDEMCFAFMYATL